MDEYAEWVPYSTNHTHTLCQIFLLIEFNMPICRMICAFMCTYVVFCEECVKKKCFAHFWEKYERTARSIEMILFGFGWYVSER